MAVCDFVIRNDVRPCLVDGTRALWHQWVQHSEIVLPSPLKGGHHGGVVAGCFALVEYEDGTTAKVNVDRVRFLDSKERFGDHHKAFYPPEEKQPDKPPVINCEKCKHGEPHPMNACMVICHKDENRKKSAWNDSTCDDAEFGEWRIEQCPY